MRFFAEPAAGLVDKAELIVVNAHRSDGAFDEVKNLMPFGWAFSGDRVHLVIAIQMVLVSPVAEFHTLK